MPSRSGPRRVKQGDESTDRFTAFCGFIDNCSQRDISDTNKGKPQTLPGIDTNDYDTIAPK
jgi:hypothetical protein